VLDNKKLLPLSIIILAMSLVFGSLWIGHSIEKAVKSQIISKESFIEKALLTEEESAEYLNISITSFSRILENNIREKQELTSYPLYRFIPYIEVGNGEKRFNKKQLDEWINYNMLNK
jgi:hypothetical protein